MTKTTTATKAPTFTAITRTALVGDNMIGKESKNLATLITNSKKRVQAYLCSEVAHIEAHRNVTRINEFFATVRGSSYRVNAMHDFIQRFANVQFVEPADRPKDQPDQVYVVNKAKRDMDKALAGEDFDALDAAMSTDWTSLQAEKKPVDFSLEARAKVLVKQALSNGYALDAILQAVTDAETDAKEQIANDLEKAQAALEKANEAATKAAEMQKAAQEKVGAIEEFAH